MLKKRQTVVLLGMKEMVETHLIHNASTAIFFHTGLSAKDIHAMWILLKLRSPQ